MELSEAKKIAQGICRYEHRTSMVICFNDSKGYYVMPYVYKCNPAEVRYFCDSSGKLSEINDLQICVEI